MLTNIIQHEIQTFHKKTLPCHYFSPTNIDFYTIHHNEI